MERSIRNWGVTHFRLEIQRLIYVEGNIEGARALTARLNSDSQPAPDPTSPEEEPQHAKD